MRRLNLLPFLVGFLLASCSTVPPPPPPTKETPKPHKDSGRDLVTEAGKAIFRMRKGRPWLMEAINVHYSNGQKKASLENVDWTLSDTKGQPVIRIKSKKATYDIASQKVEFAGGTEARRFQSHDLLRAERISWTAKTGELVASGGVRWARGQTVVTGNQAVATDTLDRIRVEGDVSLVTFLEGDAF